MPRYRLRAILLCSCLAAVDLACQQESPPPPEVASGGSPVAGGGASQVTGGHVDGGVLATNLFSPQSIALGPDAVYWTTANGLPVADASAGTGGVESVPRTGGALTEVIAGLSNPQQITTSSSTLFFVQGAGGGSQVDAYVLGATTATQIGVGVGPSSPMVIDANTLYWANGDGSALSLRSVSTLGGAPSQLFTTSKAYVPVGLGVSNAAACILAKVGGDAYVLESSTAGGPPTELWHEAGDTPVGLAVSGDSVYWSLISSSEGGELLSISVGGGEVFTLASNVQNIGNVAVLSDTVYFTSNVASGAVLSVSTSGGAVSTLASGLDYPSAIAVDDAVYVGTTSTITRIPL